MLDHETKRANDGDVVAWDGAGGAGPAIGWRAAERGTEPAVAAFELRLRDKLRYVLGKPQEAASRQDWLVATVLSVRDEIVDRWFENERQTARRDEKQVAYLSMEFLPGRLLREAIVNLGIERTVCEALERGGHNLDQIASLEPDPALGNGGLGRLAACLMEAMATLEVPACGYGIRFAHGLFRQAIVDGEQVEQPETWLEAGNPWEFERGALRYQIGFGGTSEAAGTDQGRVWRPSERLVAVAHDMPVVGWRGRVNTLRLWDARPADPFQLSAFNAGDHFGAIRPLGLAKLITRQLYPADLLPQGKELRLRQEYFFSSASLQDIVRRHLASHASLANLAECVSVQLNDTHPAVGIPELMRLLMDEHGFGWNEAWEITRGTFSYTNHTLLPEALESWPVDLFQRLLPRHLEIVYEINARMLAQAGQASGPQQVDIASLSLIDEQDGRKVRMGNLAFVGSHAVNGVSRLHTRLMKDTVFGDLNALYPGRIRNKTNGIAMRRWLMQANRGLAALIEDHIGPGFRDDPMLLGELAPLAQEPCFLDQFAAIKLDNKRRLARVIEQAIGVVVDPNALFDVQVKRIHEYKRQLLNVLEAIALYRHIRRSPDHNWTPRVKLFAGKAAPDYQEARQIIRLINDVASVVNADPLIAGRLKIVFMPDYNVSLAELIMPAADISEQISTAGFEASGTGNMKLALNGALTIGTLDGANVEMLEHVGAANMFIFGLTAEEVAQRRGQRAGGREDIEANDVLADALEAVASGLFCPHEPERYRKLVERLYADDQWMVAADFGDYWDVQRQLDSLRADARDWQAKAVLNTAAMGWFSADRTIRDYADDIWNLRPRK